MAWSQISIFSRLRAFSKIARASSAPMFKFVKCLHVFNEESLGKAEPWLIVGLFLVRQILHDV